MEIAEYQEWLASGISNRAVVECIEIAHTGFANVRIARWQEDLTVTHENGQQKIYQAGDFRIQPAGVDDTTQQSTQGVISGLDGLVYDKLLSLTTDERNEPMAVTHRLYFPDNPVQPLINPPPVWQVLAVQADGAVVTAELSAVPLRARTVGLYYTLQNFDLLRYV